MKVVAKRIKGVELSYNGVEIGVFIRGEVWNGLVKYNCVMGMYEGQYIIAAENSNLDGFGAAFLNLFGDIVDKERDGTATYELHAIMASPKLHGYLMGLGAGDTSDGDS